MEAGSSANGLANPVSSGEPSEHQIQTDKAEGKREAKHESSSDAADVTDRKNDQKSDDVKKDDPKQDEDSNKAERNQVESSNPEIESYKKLRKSLKDLVAKKIKLDHELEETEERLYVEEGAYLQEASAGNIAKGFDQYTKSSQNRRKSVLVEQDRVFSQSSTAFDAEM